MLADAGLAAALDSASRHGDEGEAREQRPPLRLTLYLTINPCHYSSSNSAASCTENLLRWRAEVLAPRGVVELRIRAAYPYRTPRCGPASSLGEVESCRRALLLTTALCP